MVQMKISFLPSFIICLTLCFLGACSSKNTAGPKRVDQESSSWDYAKIREAKAAENAEVATYKNDDADYAQCQIYSKDAMIRAKVSGCRPTDPRAGFGENTFCCPPQTP